MFASAMEVPTKVQPSESSLQEPGMKEPSPPTSPGIEGAQLLNTSSFPAPVPEATKIVKVVSSIL